MKLTVIFLVTALMTSSLAAQAVTIDLVTVDNPGNASDTEIMTDGTTGYGSVNYEYAIGKYEVTYSQWCEFLMAKARVGDPHGLYNTDMSISAGGILRSGSGTVEHPWSYTIKSGWSNRPVACVSFWDAARFCNWLHNHQGNGDTESGAYINIGNQDTFARQAGATYVIPTENEWYKSAYYKGGGTTAGYWDYSTGTDVTPDNGNPGGDTGNTANYFDGGDYSIGYPLYTSPVGYFGESESPSGTFDQGGNVWEWNEGVIGSFRSLRGGGFGTFYGYMESSCRSFSLAPTDENIGIGFRVASVPEPESISLLAVGVFAALLWRSQRRPQRQIP
jgi:formylglycine-generating enzyme